MTLRRNHHGRDIDPVHLRLRGQRARDVHLGHNSVIDQNIDHARLAVQARAGTVDLLACDQSYIAEDSEVRYSSFCCTGGNCWRGSLLQTA